MLRKGNQPPWKIWKQRHLRNVIIIFQIVLPILLVYIIPFTLFFSQYFYLLTCNTHCFYVNELSISLREDSLLFYSLMHPQCMELWLTCTAMQWVEWINALFCKNCGCLQIEKRRLRWNAINFFNIWIILLVLQGLPVQAVKIERPRFGPQICHLEATTLSMWITSIFAGITKEIENPSIWE